VLRGVFFCTINMGKFLQHKLIHVQCAKKKYPGTGIPCTPVRVFGFKQFFFLKHTTRTLNELEFWRALWVLRARFSVISAIQNCWH
jgi:hypothetical protein